MFATVKRAGVDGAKLQEILSREGKKQLSCVSCAELFTTFPVLGEQLHACVPCQGVWLGQGALDRFRALSAESGPATKATMTMAPPAAAPPTTTTTTTPAAPPPTSDMAPPAPAAAPVPATSTATISMFAAAPPPPKAPSSTASMFAATLKPTGSGEGAALSSSPPSPLAPPKSATARMGSISPAPPPGAAPGPGGTEGMKVPPPAQKQPARSASPAQAPANPPPIAAPPKAERKRPETGSLYAAETSGGSPALRVLAVLFLVGAGFLAYRVLDRAPSTELGGGKAASFGEGAVTVEAIALGLRPATKFSAVHGPGDFVAWYVPGGGTADARTGEFLLVEILGKELKLDGSPRQVGNFSVMNAAVTMGDKSGRIRAFFSDKDGWVLATLSASPGFGRTPEAERFLSSFANQ